MLNTLRNKKNVQLVSLTIAAFFILGIVGISLSQSSIGHAAPANNSAVGIVNQQMIFVALPEMDTYRTNMKTEMDNAQKEFDEKSKDMPDAEKQRYYAQLQDRLSQKDMELRAPILDKVNAAIKKVADSKGLTVVVDKQAVLYGGVDITDDVVKSLGGK